MQQLNTQHIFHPLTQNTIIAFKSRAQAIFSLSEKTHPRWFTKFVFAKFFSLFYIISTQRSHIYQKLDTNSCFAKLRAISNLFSFFLYTLYTIRYPVIRLPGYPVIRLPGYPVIRLPGYPVIRLSGYPVIRLSGYPVIRLSGYPVIRLSGYPVIWLSGYLVTRLSGYPVMRLPGFSTMP